MRIPKTLRLLLPTFFYTGFVPLIPGTFGSIAGLAVYFLTVHTPALYLGVTCLITALGFASSRQVERLLRKKDHPAIVIDEVSGMLITLAGVPATPQWILIGFFLFRLLDTLKPYPACRLQRLSGGIGVMADDIVAGCYANIVLQLAFRFSSLMIS